MPDDQRNLTARFTADTSGFSPEVDKLVQKLKSLSQEYEKNTNDIKTLNQQIKADQQELAKLTRETRDSGSATEAQNRRMQELRDSIAANSTNVGTLRAAQRDLQSQINSTTRELQEQRDAVNGVSGSVSTFGEVLKANLVGEAITSGLRQTVELLKSAAEYCYRVGSQFEAGMSQVEAISGATGEQLEALTQKAKDLGSSTRFTATESAQAMNYMAMAGWDASQMLEGIDGVLSLAAASGSDLASTADIVTDALTAFGLAAEDVGHFSDVLAAASANANTNVSMMGETFKYCAPIAGAMGYSIEDVAEAIGLMANSGIKSTMAGTALRTMLTKLSEGVTITGEKLGTLKIQTSNADGTMRSLTEVLTDMREAFALLTPAERSVAAEAIAGKNAMIGLLSLMNAGEADINKLRTAIEQCDGAAGSMAETMQDNLSGGVVKMQSALEGLGISMYDKFSDKLSDTVDIFTDGISRLTESVEDGELSGSVEHLSNSFGDLAMQVAELSVDAIPVFIDGSEQREAAERVQKGLEDVNNFFVEFFGDAGED